MSRSPTKKNLGEEGKEEGHTNESRTKIEVTSAFHSSQSKCNEAKLFQRNMQRTSIGEATKLK